MALIDFKLPKAIAAALRIPENDNRRQQVRVLKRLLKKARFTEFGQQYRFDEILLSKNPGVKFQEVVPVHDYNKIYEEWWKKTLDGVPDVSWPGKIKYYALSSGTSESASKYIPVTKEMLRSNRVNYIRQLLSLFSYEHLPRNAVTKGFLMLGGATDLQKGKQDGMPATSVASLRKTVLSGSRHFINPVEELHVSATGMKN
jgi:hypothetical protein